MSNAPVTVRTAVVSHIGCVRKNNEDNFFLDGDYMLADEVDAGTWVEYTSNKPHQIYAVCDGMGGLNGGERASLMAIEGMKPLNRKLERGRIESAIRDYAVRMSQTVYEDAQTNGSKKQGCTMSMLMIDDRIGYVANVGDSRIYLMRMGELVQVSYDHTDVYRMFMKGQLTREEVRLHPKANIINHYIGQPSEKRANDFVYYRTLLLCNGDRFLICSDGLTDLLPHEKIQDMLARTPSPSEAVESLVLAALEAGGKDNVTCIVGDIIGQDLPAQTMETLTALHMSMEKTEQTTSS